MEELACGLTCMLHHCRGRGAALFFALQDHCGRCDHYDGFYHAVDPVKAAHANPDRRILIETRCFRYEGTCENGNLAAAPARRQHDHCGSCNLGHDLVDRQCVTFTGDCTNGVAPAVADRRADGHCEMCNVGFNLVGRICARASGWCDNGVLVEAVLRTGDNECGACDEGYLLTSNATCAPACPQWAELNPTSGAMPACVEFTGTCNGGTLIAQEQRRQHNHCGVCNAGQGLFLSGRSCVGPSVLCAAFVDRNSGQGKECFSAGAAGSAKTFSFSTGAELTALAHSLPADLECVIRALVDSDGAQGYAESWGLVHDAGAAEGWGTLSRGFLFLRVAQANGDTQFPQLAAIKAVYGVSPMDALEQMAEQDGDSFAAKFAAFMTTILDTVGETVQPFLDELTEIFKLDELVGLLVGDTVKIPFVFAARGNDDSSSSAVCSPSNPILALLPFYTKLLVGSTTDEIIQAVFSLGFTPSDGACGGDGAGRKRRSVLIDVSNVPKNSSTGVPSAGLDAFSEAFTAQQSRRRSEREEAPDWCPSTTDATDDSTWPSVRHSVLRLLPV